MRPLVGSFDRRPGLGKNRWIDLVIRFTTGRLFLIVVFLLRFVFLDSRRGRMWWTLTGNYGNILPIDWSKSTARRLQLPTLQLRERQVSRRQHIHIYFVMHHLIFQVANVDEVDTLSEEDEAVASDLDLHALIVAPNHGDLDSEPVQSAEEVIKEIDDLMQVRFFFKMQNMM